jgi:hypothetical protein
MGGCLAENMDMDFGVGVGGCDCEGEYISSLLLYPPTRSNSYIHFEAFRVSNCPATNCPDPE